MGDALCEQIASLKEKYATLRESKENLLSCLKKDKHKNEKENFNDIQKIKAGPINNNFSPINNVPKSPTTRNFISRHNSQINLIEKLHKPLFLPSDFTHENETKNVAKKSKEKELERDLEIEKIIEKRKREIVVPTFESQKSNLAPQTCRTRSGSIKPEKNDLLSCRNDTKPEGAENFIERKNKILENVNECIFLYNIKLKCLKDLISII